MVVIDELNSNDHRVKANAKIIDNARFDNITLFMKISFRTREARVDEDIDELIS